jgi:hypothetical protein
MQVSIKPPVREGTSKAQRQIQQTPTTAKPIGRGPNKFSLFSANKLLPIGGVKLMTPGEQFVVGV